MKRVYLTHDPAELTAAGVEFVLAAPVLWGALELFDRGSLLLGLALLATGLLSLSVGWMFLLCSDGSRKRREAAEAAEPAVEQEGA